MIDIIPYTLFSVLLVSLVSLLGILALSWKHEKMDKILLTLVSLSAGTLFGGALLHLLPEAVERQGLTISMSLLVLAGVLLFFLLDRLVHLHHCHLPTAHEHPAQQKHAIGILSVVGDGVHNFIDGLVIAAAYFINIPTGIATTIAVIVHEIPQEIADFGVLLYAGYSKRKALLFNFLSAAVAFVGAGVGLAFGSLSEQFTLVLLPVAAGGFLYIAGSNLIPELHKECGLKDSLIHFAAMVLGIVMMVALLGLE